MAEPTPELTAKAKEWLAVFEVRTVADPSDIKSLASLLAEVREDATDAAMKLMLERIATGNKLLDECEAERDQARQERDALRARVRVLEEALRKVPDLLQEPLNEMVRACLADKPHDHARQRAFLALNRRGRGVAGRAGPGEGRESSEQASARVPSESISRVPAGLFNARVRSAGRSGLRSGTEPGGDDEPPGGGGEARGAASTLVPFHYQQGRVRLWPS